MLKVDKTNIVAKDEDAYLSFPDIVRSYNAENRLFLVYRAGDSHHPVWSKLVLLVSEDNGETWGHRVEFSSTLSQNGAVWNCPRLSYINGALHIICDMKSGTRERVAQFKTVYFISNDEGFGWAKKEVPHPGMVPDKIIRFKDKLLCANHKIKSHRNDLIQLVSWSKDDGITWYDTNVMAHSMTRQFCEASVVNMGDYLVAYLRDNSGHKRNSYMVTSEDGVYWTEPKKLPFFGQRITALKDDDKKNYTIGTFRDTELPIIYSPSKRIKVSAFEHNLNNDKIKLSKIDWEYPENQYHFGYTGMVRTAPNKYIIAYYVKQNAKNPYIKLAYVSKVK